MKCLFLHTDSLTKRLTDQELAYLRSVVKVESWIQVKEDHVAYSWLHLKLNAQPMETNK